MQNSATYFGFLDSIAGNTEAIEREKQRLDTIIADIAGRIRGRLTPTTVPSLLWHLATKEIERISVPIGFPVTDFAGYTRYLRALCAAVPFRSVEPREDPKTEELFEQCRLLWTAMSNRETIVDLKNVGDRSLQRRQRRLVSMTSLLEALQGEILYFEQVEERVERLFAPFSTEIIEPKLGISTSDIVKGFDRVRRTIPERFERSSDLMKPAREMMEEWRKRSRAGATDEELDRFVFDHPTYEQMNNNVAASFREINRILLFRSSDFSDVLGERAAAFLNVFSFIPGEVNVDVRTPYDDDIVRQRPFAKIGTDEFVLMDVAYSSFSPPHRLLECFDTDRKLERLNKRRDKSLESEAARLFCEVINPDTILRSYCLPVGDSGSLAERDLLLLKDNCAFVIESKARPLRSVLQRRDKLTRIATDVEHSIQEGYDQADSVIRLLKGASGLVPVFDSDGRQTSELDVSRIEEFFPIVFLDSYYGFIATDLEPWLNVNKDVGYPWVVDRDTFSSIILKIDSDTKISSFLKWRRTLHGVAANEDEAVFAGCFLTHGPCKMPDNARVVQLPADYADIFEAEYFHRKGFDVEMPRENIGPPVWTSMQRVGDEIKFKIHGKVRDVINIKTGESGRAYQRRKQPRLDGRIGRNDSCPCGSGKKFKKCCLLQR